MIDETSSAIDERLLDYLDGTLPANECTDLERLLRQDGTVAARLEELRLMHRLMGAQKLEVPSPNFTASVMQQLKEEPATRGQVIRGILMITGILSIIGIAAALVSAGVFDSTLATLDLNEMDPARRYITHPAFPTFSLSSKVIVNGIIILNLILAFFVLDRTVLRPLFRQRSHAH